ncbi:MAG: 30S ribosome-binding factor RbfA [Dehalococcoidales bacterium]|nr:30S ribosome-binding factor RbfA [Dehalococcoidales bacterium]
MTHRIERLNHLIRQEISQLLQRHVKDPRLGNFIAVTSVETSPDLRTAKVYISHLGTEADKTATISAITSASGFFRKELAKNLTLRRVPELSFHWDDSIERGAHIEELIERVHSEKDLERDS